MHCTALHCTVLHCTALHCTALHCTTLHFTALHCTVLHFTVLHFTVLYVCACSVCDILNIRVKDTCQVYITYALGLQEFISIKKGHFTYFFTILFTLNRKGLFAYCSRPPHFAPFQPKITNWPTPPSPLIISERNLTPPCPLVRNHTLSHSS